ncbi:hypothetical protein SAMD00019534_015870, partial [Acytostelium subglobosum LB1]|uniref:hypothetical protein n=1 Tax=Acytostelium subglobosum LB1 TaxID=1410327 RepID=UPI0006451A63
RMSDVWLNEFENASRVLNQLSSEVKDYEVAQRNNPALVQRQTAPNIRRNLVNLSNDLNRLIDTLTYGNLRITEKESLRRRATVEQLITKKNNLASQFEAAANNTSAKYVYITMNDLMGDASGKRAWGKQSKETEYTKDMDNQQLFNKQNQVMDEQDQTLDLLSGSLLRQKNMATAMNSELTNQNLMLDDVESGVTKVSSRLVSTNNKMETLRQNAGSCGLILVIVLLIIVIIILLATDSGCKIYNDPKHCP